MQTMHDLDLNVDSHSRYNVPEVRRETPPCGSTTSENVINGLAESRSSVENVMLLSQNEQYFVLIYLTAMTNISCILHSCNIVDLCSRHPHRHIIKENLPPPPTAVKEKYLCPLQ